MNQTERIAAIGVGRAVCGKATAFYRLAQEFGGSYCDIGATLRAAKGRLLGMDDSEPRVDYRFIDELFGSSSLKQAINLDALAPLMQTGIVNNSIIIPLLRAWIHVHRKSNLAVIDGAPRDDVQARFMLPVLKGTGFVNYTVWFKTPASVCLSRPSRSGRDDDTPEARLRRMNDFDRFTAPIEGIMRARTRFIEIDNSDLRPHETYARIVAALGLSTAVETVGTS